MTTPRLANHKKVIAINGQLLIQAINGNATSIRAVARRCNVSFNALSIAIRRNEWQTHLPLRTLTDVCDCLGLQVSDLLTTPPQTHDVAFRIEPTHRDHPDSEEPPSIHRLAALILSAGRPHSPSEIALALGCTLETLDDLREALNAVLEGSGIYLRFANDALYLTTTADTSRTARETDLRNLNLVASRDRPFDNTTLRIIWEVSHGHTKNTYTHAEAPRLGLAMNMGLLEPGATATTPVVSEVLKDAFPGISVSDKRRRSASRKSKATRHGAP